MTLYGIDNHIKTILDALMDATDENGEVADVRDIDFAELERLNADRKSKLENIALYIKNLEAEADAIKAEEANLKARRDRLTNKADGLRWLMIRSMTESNDTELETPKCSAKIKTTESTDIVDIDLIPDEYIKLKVDKQADKTAIKKAIKNGKEIAGARLVLNTKVRIE